MQSTIAEPTLPIPNLLHVFATIPDPRTRRGRRYSLAALLTIAVAGILANHTSVLAIAEWAAALRGHARTRLGLRPGMAPHQTTFARLFRRIDPAALTIALTHAFDPRRPAVLPPRGSQGIALDGKTHRRRWAMAPTSGTPIHAVSLVDHVRGVILAHHPIMAAQGETEASVAAALVQRLSWTGRVLTGDALHGHAALCMTVLAAGGDYLFPVKGNQPTLLQEIQWLFAEPALLDDQRTAETISCGHGRREHRQIVVSTDLAGYSRWPGLAQVFQITRTWTDGQGKEHREVSFGVTSLPPTAADAARLLAVKRGHWTIENRVHYVKDVSLGEDASAMRADHGPRVLALLRDSVLNLLRLGGHRSVAAALRHYSRNPQAVLALVGVLRSENA
jgi:predicted transposase YbfD/YdcC